MYITKTLQSHINDGSTYFTTLVPKQTLQEAINTIGQLSGGDSVREILRHVRDQEMDVTQALVYLQAIADGEFNDGWLK